MSAIIKYYLMQFEEKNDLSIRTRFQLRKVEKKKSSFTRRRSYFVLLKEKNVFLKGELMNSIGNI